MRSARFPVGYSSSFTFGGTGGLIAYNSEEFADAISHALDMSPVHEALVEESVLGWKEYELEVMRDYRDNFVVICTIENFDPMGVHTGDSITVAPAQTLTDKEFQRMRDAAAAIVREVGVETGGSNVQFAINPENGKMTVIEMNPRVSRSSALASKATGFPIAKIAARLAVGMSLDEIPNDITKKTPACFEPTIDYVVVKIPKWQFEKFPWCRQHAGNANEIRWRSDGHRANLQRGTAEGDSVAGAQHAMARARRDAGFFAARKTGHTAPRSHSLVADRRGTRFAVGRNLRANKNRSMVHSTD